MKAAYFLLAFGLFTLATAETIQKWRTPGGGLYFGDQSPVGSASVIAVAAGIGADYAIYFLYRPREEHSLTASDPDATRKARPLALTPPGGLRHRPADRTGQHGTCRPGEEKRPWPISRT